MRLRGSIAIAAWLVCAAAPAIAADPPKPVAAARQDPRAEALVRRYLKATDLERNMDVMLSSLMPVVAAQMQARSPGLSEEQRRTIAEAVLKVMREKGTPRLIERMVPIFAETFTVQELDALVAFYESPIGRSVTSKTPSLAPRATQVSQELMPELMQAAVLEVLEQLCPGGKCPDAPPKLRPS